MAASSPQAEAAKPSQAPANGAIPPLKDGDRLTRAEFERRYMAMPDLKKAELIEGVVHVASPVRQRFHGRQHSHLNFWLCAMRDGPRVSRSVTIAPYGSTLITCPSQIACCSFSRNMEGASGLARTAISKGLPTWSPRSPLAARASISERNSKLIGEMVFASTWSGEFSIDRLTGS